MSLEEIKAFVEKLKNRLSMDGSNQEYKSIRERMTVKSIKDLTPIHSYLKCEQTESKTHIQLVEDIMFALTGKSAVNP